jgi:hypothetical protein
MISMMGNAITTQIAASHNKTAASIAPTNMDNAAIPNARVHDDCCARGIMYTANFPITNGTMTMNASDNVEVALSNTEPNKKRASAPYNNAIAMDGTKERRERKRVVTIFRLPVGAKHFQKRTRIE